jgi:alkylated DNA repair dioxygenase AlkB
MQGLTLIPDFISEQEEQNLINNINNATWNKSLRQLTQHYGYTYNYRSKSIDKLHDKTQPIPEWIEVFVDRMIENKYISIRPDQVIINRYMPGEGMGAHIDRVNLFKEKIFSIGLGGSCKMIFKKPLYVYSSEDEYVYQLVPKTLLIMEGDARYKYTHEIPAARFDYYRVSLLTAKRKRVARTTRYLITFRNIK